LETPGVKGCCVGYKPNFPWQAPSLCTVSHECHFLKFGRGCAFVNLTIARFQRQISPNTFTAENTLSHSSSSRLGGQNLWVKLHRGIGGLKGELSVIFFFRGGSRVPRLQKKERGIGMVTGRIGERELLGRSVNKTVRVPFTRGSATQTHGQNPQARLSAKASGCPGGGAKGGFGRGAGGGLATEAFAARVLLQIHPGGASLGGVVPLANFLVRQHLGDLVKKLVDV